MTAEFNEVGLRFLYPENWSVVRDDVAGWPKSVSVHGPDGAFWCINEDQHGTADDLLAQVIAGVEAEYDEVEAEVVERQVGEQFLTGTQLSFYCLDFLITAQVLQCSKNDRRLVFLYQAESKDFDKLCGVFDAITFSFLTSIEAVDR
jgi:hypothetical protein